MKKGMTIIFSILVLVILYGCKPAEKKAAQIEEEVVDSGALTIASTPDHSAVYISDDYKGETPVELYNIAVGKYEVVIKTEGYSDFKKSVAIEVGRTAEIDATLFPLESTKDSKNTMEPSKDTTSLLAKEESINNSDQNEGKINFTGFSMYFDFEGKQFGQQRTDKSDLFVKNYENYVYFTAIVPAEVQIIQKPIKEVDKFDCIFSGTTVASLYSSQTACIKTVEGNIVAVGGAFEKPNELQWKSFS